MRNVIPILVGHTPRWTLAQIGMEGGIVIQSWTLENYLKDKNVKYRSDTWLGSSSKKASSHPKPLSSSIGNEGSFPRPGKRRQNRTIRICLFCASGECPVLDSISPETSPHPTKLAFNVHHLLITYNNTVKYFFRGRVYRWVNV
ncbi:MAG: hypothetical protein B6U69_04260 [Thermofilum sp. ex4484_15]|nr:MAG: hypothetical protein B6U69_04260 [Thermofilum sp. ex4484_15]